MNIYKGLLSAAILSATVASFGLTLDEALSHAWEYNPSLSAVRASTRAVEQGINVSRSSLLPQVNAYGTAGATDTAGQGFDSVNDGSRYTTGAGVNLSQTLFNKGQYHDFQGSKYVYAAQLANLHVQEQALLMAAVSSYINTQRDYEIFKLQEQYETLLKQQYDATVAQVNVGELTPTDQYLSEAAWRGAIATKTGSFASFSASQASFIQLIGLAPKNLKAAYIPTQYIPKDKATATSLALQNNATIVAAAEDVKAKQQLLKSAQAGRMPTLTADASVGYNDYYSEDGIFVDVSGGSTTASANINLNIPLYTGGAVTAQIEASQADLLAAEMLLENSKTLAEENITTAWEIYRASIEQVNAYENQIRASTQSLKGVREEYNVGSRSLIDVLNEEANYLTAKVNYANAYATKISAAWNVLQTIGILTPDVFNLNR